MSVGSRERGGSDASPLCRRGNVLVVDGLEENGFRDRVRAADGRALMHLNMAM